MRSWMIIAFAGFVIVGYIALIYDSWTESRKWELWANLHCHTIGKLFMSPYTVEPNKIGYSCDDGQTYWR